MSKTKIVDFFSNSNSPIQKINDKQWEYRNVALYVKREDLLHPLVSGNKFRKLKYNIIEAEGQRMDTLLTFGGAYSNHIHAVAAAGHLLGFKTIGVIRGEEILPLNLTLHDAAKWGMSFHFVSRSEYKEKYSPSFISNLKQLFGDFYLVPEGGTNDMAVLGASELFFGQEVDFDYVCLCSGTGGTSTGVIGSVPNRVKVLSFPVLKGGEFLRPIIQSLLHSKDANWDLITDYHFGGYAKHSPSLVKFINEMYASHNLPLDPVYTGKMFYGLYDMLEKGYFPEGSKVLAVHTGGLQGIRGFNQRFHNCLNINF